MHRLRQEQPDFGDPVPIVAHTIAAETRVLCFDEFQVTDVADALVIRRLFRHLFAHGLVMVATSNRPPSQLYLHGVQREHFVPFIDDLNERCECHDLESPTDYRMLAHVSSGARMYLHPLDENTAAEVSQLVSQSVRRPVSQSWSHSPGPRVTRSRVSHRRRRCFRILPRAAWRSGRYGCARASFRRRDAAKIAPRLRSNTHAARAAQVPQAGATAAVAKFTFHELCGRPLGTEQHTRQ